MQTTVESFKTLVQSIRNKAVSVYIETDGVSKIITPTRAKGQFRLTNLDTQKFEFVMITNLEKAFETEKKKFSVWFSDPMDHNMEYVENLSNEVLKLLEHLDANGLIGRTPSIREANEKSIASFNQEIEEQQNLILATLKGRSFYQYEQDQLAALLAKK